MRNVTKTKLKINRATEVQRSQIAAHQTQQLCRFTKGTMVIPWQMHQLVIWQDSEWSSVGSNNPPHSPDPNHLPSKNSPFLGCNLYKVHQTKYTKCQKPPLPHQSTSSLLCALNLLCQSIDPFLPHHLCSLLDMPDNVFIWLLNSATECWIV